MSWATLTPTESVDFERAPAGSHGAVLVAIVDLGTQEESFNNEPPKDVHQAYFVWELTDCKQTGSDHNLLIGKVYKMSLHEKSNLRQMIKSWRGKDIAHGEQFDPLKMLGQKCMLSIVDKVSTGGKTNSAISAVSGVPKGMKVDAAKRSPFERHISSTTPIPDWLPYIFGESVDKVAARAKEITGAAPAPKVTKANGNGAGGPADPAQVSEDQIPF